MQVYQVQWEVVQSKFHFKAWEYSVNFLKELEAEEREGEANYFTLFGFYDCVGNACIYSFPTVYMEMVSCHHTPS